MSKDKKFWLGQLRHAYHLALTGHVGTLEGFAKYLLGPAIEGAEEYVTATEALEEAAKARNEAAKPDQALLDAMLPPIDKLLGSICLYCKAYGPSAFCSDPGCKNNKGGD